MRLASAEDVVALLGIMDNEGSKAHAGLALDIVTSIIEERLGTGLASATYQDYFDYSYSRYRKAFEPVTYRLSAGYLTDDAVQVRQSSNGDALEDDADGVEVAASKYLIDRERGILTLRSDVTVGRQTLMISYKAGFESINDQLSDERAPEWLKKCALVSAVRLIQMNPTNLANKKVSVLRDVQNAIGDTLSQILNPHLRPRMGLIWPARTVAELG